LIGFKEWRDEESEFLRVLEISRFLGEKGSQSISIFLGRFVPKGADRGPFVAQTFFASVSVVGNEGRNQLGMVQGETEPGRERRNRHVDREFFQTDLLRKFPDDLGQMVNV
jgi:hypothetical protein